MPNKEKKKYKKVYGAEGSATADQKYVYRGKDNDGKSYITRYGDKRYTTVKERNPDSTADKKKQGSYITRHYTTKRGDYIDDKGRYTPYALGPLNWGRNSPLKNDQDRREYLAYGRRMLEQAEKAEMSEDVLMTVEKSYRYEFDEDGKMIVTPVLSPGKLKHDIYGTMNITEAVLDEMKENFDEQVRGVDLVLDENHDPDHKSRGVFKELFFKTVDGVKQLWAKIKPNQKGLQLMKEGEYMYFSPEFAFQWAHPKTGKKFKNVLFGGALTNRPFQKDLEKVTILSEKIMLEEDKKDNTNPEEIEGVDQDPTEGTVEETDETTEGTTETTSGDVTEEVLKEEPTQEPRDEGTAQLSELVTKIRLLERREFVRQLAEKANTFIWSEKKQVGQFKPEAKAELVKFMETLTQPQYEAFESLMKQVVKPVSFGESGFTGTGVGQKPASVLLSERAMKLVAEKGIEYSLAEDAVKVESPDLWAEVQKEYLQR